MCIRQRILQVAFTKRPRPSEGQFFGQVGGEHFVLQSDETKWCAFRASFCR
jgi:hypothetical protein